MKPKTKTHGRSGRASSTALALGSCLLLAVTACAEGEGRDAPEDTAAAERAEDWAEEAAPEDVTPDRGAEPTDEARAPDAGAPATDRPTGEAAERTVPAGTSLVFTVDEAVSTGEDDVGDQFTATLQSAVTGSGGVVLIPAGTPSRWTVQEATTEGGQTVLAAQFESIQLDGEWRSVPATVTSADIQADTAATGTESAAKVGVGAAAGALIGQILGEDTRSTLTGAGVGAAVGGAVALATRGASATLPAGSALTVELTEPLAVTP